MKILIVDDSKTMRHVLASQLKELGYETVLEADCVDQAKRVCSGEPPDLIISDWNMPGATGLDFLKYIRGNAPTRDTPFVMLTTETDKNKIVDATRAGLQSYLLKPIKKPILNEKLRELAAAYGFKAPAGESVVVSVAATQDASKTQQIVNPLKGKIKKEQIAPVLEIFKKVWKQQSTVINFEEHVAKEIFGGTLEEKLEEVELFMETILEAAQDAIDYKLNRLV